MERLVSFFGLFVMIGLAWLLSSNKRILPLRVIIGGLLLQFGLALFILKTGVGQQIFSSVGLFFEDIIGYTKAGSGFLFGIEAPGGSPSLQLLTSFAFGVLPTIVFFSALMGVLYYLGLMQRAVAGFAWVMQKTLGTSGAESLSATANIFLGQTEAPLAIRPYIARMTRSELMAVMVGGFATIAGSVMAAYIGMGISAGHLLTASIISAPAALLIAKVMQPEVERPATLGTVALEAPVQGTGIIDALSIGALDGMKLALNVAAMLIAFLAFVAMLDGCIGWVGSLLGYEWTFASLLGYAFAPLAWLMGVEPADIFHVGELLGLRMATNEFVAYHQMSQWMQPDSPVHLTERSQVILTYALAGFANFSSIGIQIGGIGGMAPERRSDIAQLGLRAMIGGTLACFMTACIAGILL